MRLHAAREGEGSPLVLLHPVGLDGACWGAAEGLRERFALIRIDLAGHGESDPARAGQDLEAYALDVAETLDGLACGPCFVAGVSFGGMVAQHLALADPGLVSALVLAGCPASVPDVLRPILAERGAAAERGGMASVVEPTVERWFTPAFRSAPAADAVRARLLADTPASWANAWRAIAGLDTLDALGRIGVPTLVLAGALDAATPAALSQQLADAIPGARYAALPGAPHMMQIECADAFARAIIDFADDC